MADTQPNPVLDYLRAQAEARVHADASLFDHLRAYSSAGMAVPWPMLARMLVTKAEAN